VSCWAIVAVKSRAQCKLRLAGVLAPHERLELVRRMLDHVLTVAGASAEIDRVLVVSPERDRVPPSIGIVADAGTGLNEALEVARSRARAAHVDEIVVLPADLPRLTTQDVETLITAGRHAGIAVAGDSAHVGTNGLYLSPTLDLAFSFGSHSLEAHLAAARALGIRPAIVRRPGFELDVDTPRDLECLEGASRVGGSQRSRSHSYMGR
jgi:2-phospho-L-lactate guanylyltransferase